MVDLSTVLSIAQRSLLAARTALNVTANNIANADTPEYVRREAILEAAPAVSTSEGTIGGGVQIAQIKRRFDQLLTTQVLDFQGQFSRDSVLGDVLDEVEVFFQNTDGSGLGTDISRFFGAVQDLANNPSGNAERTALQVVTSRMADTFRTTEQTITDIRRGVDNEVRNMVDQLSTMASEIAKLNQEISSQGTADGGSDLLDRRDKLIRDMSELINIKTTGETNGSITVTLGGNKVLVSDAFAVKFLAETDAGNLGFADVKIEDFSGGKQSASSQITGGRLGGLLSVRDTKLGAYTTDLDTLASTLVQQVNLIHTQGVGLQAATQLTTDYPVSSTTGELGTTAGGLPFSSLVKDGSFEVIVYDSAGAVSSQTTITIDKDPGGTTLTSLATSLSAIANLTATVDSTTGKMTVTASGSNRFAFRNDTSQVLTALGLNNLLKGSTASDIALGTEVAANANLIATAKADASGVFVVGDNTNALNLGDLENSKLFASNTQTFQEAFAALVGKVGNDVADAKNGVQRSELLLNRMEERRTAVSGVSMDEELANIIRFQQAYSAAARLVVIAQDLMDSLLQFLG